MEASHLSKFETCEEVQLKLFERNSNVNKMLSF